MDYRNFLEILNGGRGITLFEPFPTRKLVTQIIWRGGDELWTKPKRRAETLIEFYHYIDSDVVPIEPRGESEMLDAELPDGMRFVVISDDPDELGAADRNDKVCALATRGEFIETRKPLIFLAKDDVAVYKRFAGVYLAGFRGGVDLPVLGGIGSEFINTEPPLRIYERVEALVNAGVKAIGTGSFGEETGYLGFISMLGKYKKLREE